jgi:hypothetical protein
MDIDASRHRWKIGIEINRFVILEASPSEAKAMNSGIHASESTIQSR